MAGKLKKIIVPQTETDVCALKNNGGQVCHTSLLLPSCSLPILILFTVLLHKNKINSNIWEI